MDRAACSPRQRPSQSQVAAGTRVETADTKAAGNARSLRHGARGPAPAASCRLQASAGLKGSVGAAAGARASLMLSGCSLCARRTFSSPRSVHSLRGSQTVWTSHGSTGSARGPPPRRKRWGHFPKTHALRINTQTARGLNKGGAQTVSAAVTCCARLLLESTRLKLWSILMGPLAGTAPA